MSYSHRFAEALHYAATLHQLQLRKSTKIPYIGHLLGVASTVIDAGGDEDEAIAAVLHDAAEDQGGLARLADLRERFGSRVADIVQACSDPLDESGKSQLPYEEKKMRYLTHLRESADASAYLVSVADKLHNARATLADFRAGGHSVWDQFNAGRTSILQTYDNLIMTYRLGPPDERRVPVVDELEAVVNALRLESAPERALV
jgi:(p)ppGpp synthase/HD superfamily hydrolase